MHTDPGALRILLLGSSQARSHPQAVGLPPRDLSPRLLPHLVKVGGGLLGAGHEPGVHTHRHSLGGSLADTV